MKAVVISKPGDPEVLRVEELERPLVGDMEVLIEVRAAGVNRPDVFQRKGNYPAPPGVDPRIPGLEVAGIIVEKGSLVDGWNIGDSVCALVAGGGYASYVSVYQGHCLPIPANLSFEEAAALLRQYSPCGTMSFAGENYNLGNTSWCMVGPAESVVQLFN
ncbi:alcohol dehydrogenase catalytic domain-containing protein [Sphingobacterium sp. E70]|uniref:alcohol dehydrogenase catalytic domain-containing protein n=1 Tax=Sphingobacterium sp. E70 TaxID=2853439 RepID=UPI00211CC74B|nr:alcohol dehydrogenase catalytic domain-containing protein [Sphingobacterium sp. E70]ULT23013.1 alcohol dehydrogenase catalytic domain-containing protein [Sphingobacterium sp. E70]